ncbi:MAG: EAL domain-containing protein [Methyloprofundus sp.]|nr:EAL domain-containing protein [Methyloprofundus sp.]
MLIVFLLIQRYQQQKTSKNLAQNKKILAKDFNRIAINISPAQFNRPDFIKKVQNTIKSTGVDTKHLEIELTESALQESTHFVIEKLNAIKALGINIAIDDFGTGYSSLSRLKALPIDLLKIDRAFVTDICNNHEDLEIITAIIKMASALNIDTLAEGIEKENQAITLKELSCNFGQGFLFSKAIDAPSFTHSLISSNLTT